MDTTLHTAMLDQAWRVLFIDYLPVRQNCTRKCQNPVNQKMIKANQVRKVATNGSAGAGIGPRIQDAGENVRVKIFDQTRLLDLLKTDRFR